MVYPALLPLMRTRRLPVVDWTDAPADLNGLVRFAERRNLVSARVPSHFKRSLHLDPLPFHHAVLLRDRDIFTFTFGVCRRVTRDRKWIVGRRSWSLEHHVYFRSLCTCKCWNNNRNKTVSDLRKWRSRFQKGHWTTAIPYGALPWNGQGGLELTWGTPPFSAAWGTSRKISLYLSYDCVCLEF
jgi:hypothetical protein